MVQLTVTAKGQITLKKELLARLGVKPGDKVELEINDDGSVSLSAAKGDEALEAFIGGLKDETDVRLTIEEINEAIAECWAKGNAA